MAIPPPAIAPTLHRFLGIGLVILLGTAGVMKLMGKVPMLPPDDVTRTIAYIFSGIAAALILVALLMFKPGVPERRAGETMEAYWTTQATVMKIMRVWFVLEGAGVMATVGFFMTGYSVVFVAAAITVAIYWWCGPAAFAKP